MAGYGRTLLSAPPCVSFRGMKIGRQAPTILPLPGDIRQRSEAFSRPMTGHTPQKLPSFNAISCIIALHAGHPQTCTAMIPLGQQKVKHFFRIFYKDLPLFSYITEIFASGQLYSICGRLPVSPKRGPAAEPACYIYCVITVITTTQKKKSRVPFRPVHSVSSSAFIFSAMASQINRFRLFP